MTAKLETTGASVRQALLNHATSLAHAARSKHAPQETIATAMMRGQVLSLFGASPSLSTPLQAAAEKAFHSLEEAVMVAFDRYTDRIDLDNNTPIDINDKQPRASSRIKLANPELHIVAAGNHSYELGYTARNYLGFAAQWSCYN